jgi:tetratricopeptide (TPR) repeat protein
MRLGKFQSGRLSLISLLLAVGILAGCTSSEDREAKYYDRAQQQFEDGNLEKAFLEVKNVLQINPNNARARFLLGKIKYKEEDWRKAYSNFDMAVELDPSFEEARLELGKLQLAFGTADQAEEQVRAVLELNPDSAEALGLLSGIYHRQKKTAEAEKEALAVLAKDPAQALAISTLVAIYGADDYDKTIGILDDGIKAAKGAEQKNFLEFVKVNYMGSQGKVEESIALYKQMIAEAEDPLPMENQLLKAYQQVGQKDNYQALLEGMLTRYPDNTDVKLNWIKFLASIEQIERGREELLGFIAADPENFTLKTGLADLYIATKEIDKAKGVYESVVNQDPLGPNGLAARNKLVNFALVENDRETAEKLITDILEIEAENGDALIARARLAMAGRDWKAAIADLRAVLKNDPQSVTALTLLAAAQEQDGAVSLAMDNYQAILSLEGNNVGALYNLGRLHQKQGNAESAEFFLQSAMNNKPDNTEIIRLLAATKNKLGKHDEAIKLATQLAESENTKVSAQGHFMLGAIELGRQNNEAAIGHFETSLAVQPAAIEPMGYLLQAYFKAGQQKKAMAYLQNHIEQYPEHSHAWAAMGSIQQREGDAEASRNSYRKAIELAPEKPGYYQGLAGSYYQAGEADVAIKVLREGIQHNPGNEELLNSLASIYSLQKSYAEARDAYEQVLEANPGSKVAANNLALLLADYFDGEADLQRAQDLASQFAESDVPAFRDTLGWVLYRMGNYPQAISMITAAMRNGGEGAEYHYHLGMAYYKDGQADRAKDELGKAVAEAGERDAWLEEARSVLKSL